MKTKVMFGFCILILIIPFIQAAPILNNTFEDNTTANWFVHAGAVNGTVETNWTNPINDSFSLWNYPLVNNYEASYTNHTATNNDYTITGWVNVDRSAANKWTYFYIADVDGTGKHYWDNYHSIRCQPQVQNWQKPGGGNSGIGCDATRKISAYVNFSAGNSWVSWRIDDYQFENHSGEDVGLVNLANKIVLSSQVGNYVMSDDWCICPSMTEGVWNETCCQAGAPPPVGSNDTINLSAPNPETNVGYTTLPIMFNVTGNFTYFPNTNCSLYINGTRNATVLDVANGTNVFVNFTLRNTTEGNNTWYINCNDNTTSENTTPRWFLFDFEPPAINDDFINNTMLFRDNLTGQFNLSDNLLIHRVNVTLDGNVTIFNATHLHLANYTFNLSYNITNLSLGRHILFVEIADGHTLSVLRRSESYNPSNGVFNDYAKYSIREPYKRTTITVESKNKNLFDNWEIIPGVDRYSEVFSPYNKGDTQVLRVTSTRPLYIARMPGAYGDEWLITGNHWRDFVLRGEPDARVSIRLIDDFEAEVTISGIKNNQAELRFDSIGDLNIVNVTYDFYKINFSDSFFPAVRSQHNTTYNFTVDFGELHFPIGGFTPAAFIDYNNSNTTTTLANFSNTTAIFTTSLITPLVNADTNFTFHFDFNFSNLTGGFISSLNSTQLVVNFTGNSINFTFIRLPSNTPLLQQVNLTLVGATITYNFDNITTGSYYATRLNNDTYAISADSEGFLPPSAVQSLSNNTNVNITLYFSNGTEEILWSVIDNQFDPIPNATLSFIQVVNGTPQLITQVVTDFSGTTEAFLDSSVTYTFNVTRPGFDTFFGEVHPILSEYTVTLDSILSPFYSAIGDVARINTWMNYTPNASWGVINISVGSLVAPGVVEYFGFNATYNNTNFFVNFSGVAGGGSTGVNITPILLADDNTVEVLFFVKISDFTVRRFGETYYLQEFTGNITSLTGGLFDDLGDLSPAGRAILAMFLVVLSTLTITVATRSLSAGTVVGMMVLGGTVVGGLFPLEVVNGFNSGLAATTSLVVLGFLLITDQLVGRVRT